MKSIIKAIKETSWTVRLLIVIGISLCSIPLVSSIHSGIQQNNMISTYESKVKHTDKAKINEQIQKAHNYNDMLFQTMGASVGDIDTAILSDESYENILNLSDNGIMGSIEIPKIGVDLPIYHGTSDDVLSNGVGHLQNSSFPVGGENTRTVLTGHRGLPNAKLFTRLDELKELLDYMIYSKDRSDSWYPDLMAISSKTIISILEDYGYNIPTYMKRLTWNDDYADNAHFIATDTFNDIHEFYLKNKKAFTLTKDSIIIELGNDAASKKTLTSWVNTLPPEVQTKSISTRDCNKMTMNRREFESCSHIKFKRFGWF